MIERYKGEIEKSGGKIHRLENWGRRQLGLPNSEGSQGNLRFNERRG